MGRKLSTNLPQLQSAMVPEWSYLTQYCQADKLYKQRIKQNYDQRHGTAVLPELPNESPVLVEDQSGHQRGSGFTVEPADAPRSYTCTCMVKPLRVESSGEIAINLSLSLCLNLSQQNLLLSMSPLLQVSLYPSVVQL